MGGLNQLPRSRPPAILRPKPKLRTFVKAIKKSVADSFLEEIVKLSFSVDGDINSIDYFVINALKNGETRIVGAYHCPDNEASDYTVIDDSQVDYQGSIVYTLFMVHENKKISGPFNLGNVIIGSGV
jgi:hypothetical protein